MAKAPISLHPLFPAIVAVWFAALLGLGSLILPAALLERFVGAAGIAAALPAAAPPLGLTARLLIALAAAAIGAGFGLLIARQVAHAHAASGDGARAPSRDGPRNDWRPINAHEELGDEGLGPHGRRWLAGGEARPIPTSALPVTVRQAEPVDAFVEPGVESAEEPLDLLDFADEAFDHAWEGRPETSTEPQDSWMPDERPEPLHREAEPEFAPALAEASDPAGAPEWATAPLESLGLVQLVQRLGSSLEQRRERIAAAARAPNTLPAAPVEFEAAPADEAAQAMAAYFGRADGEAPAPDDNAYASLLDIGRDDALELPFAAPVGETPRPFDPPAGRPLRHDPDSTPAYASPADADEALRRALATLQRMSSAG